MTTHLFTPKGRRFFEDSDWDEEAKRRAASGGGGTVWYVGSGVPAGGLYFENDFYIDSTDYKVYKKTGPSTWTYQGIILLGPAGTPGSRWFSDFGDPVFAGVTGMIEGDHYLDLFSGDVYKYESGSWGSSYINLTGPSGVPGTSGSRWYSDSGNPNTLGQTFVTTGDHYLDIDNGNYYKSNGTSPNFWILQGNLTGPTGDDGAPGSIWHFGVASPPSDTLGIVNDYYINVLNGLIYVKTGPTTWLWLGTLKGIDGTNGVDGQPGSKILITSMGEAPDSGVAHVDNNWVNMLRP